MRGATTPRRRAGLLLALAAAGTSAAGASCAARATPAAPAVARPAAFAPPPASTAPAPDPPWLMDIETELGALRGLPFKRRVPFGSQTRASFRDDVRTQLLRDLPAAKSAKLSRAYAAFGFVAPGFDLSRAMEDALATQVAAYYDPKTRAFKIVEAQTGSPDKKGRSTVVAHELTHALQDQYFDLASFCDDDEKGGLDDDQRVARRFVSEGEATFLMMAHDLGSGPPAERRLGPLAVAGLRMNITMSAAADMLELLAALRQGSSAASLDPETRTELAALEKLPPLVTMPLLEPYLKGALFVSEVWAKGGWPAVDALYRLPPESTEQVLHPADKFLPAREPPVHVRLRADGPPAAPGAALLTSEVVGELGWRIYFKTWGLRAGDQAAAGWGGDRFWAWAFGDRTMVAIATRWDSDADAREFFDAYEATLAARFPRRPAAANGAAGLRLEWPDGSLLTLERRGRDVDVVAGAMIAELGPAQDALRFADRRNEEPPRR